jgi:hypothetical protein
MLRHIGLLSAALLLAACSVAVPPSSPPPTSSSAPASQATIETPAPLDPDVIGLTCGTGPAFHPALLEAPGHAETEGDATGAALRDYLSGPEGGGIPATGWTRVAQLADYVQFVAPGAFDSGWAILAFVLRDGRWELGVVGECHLGPAVPDGVSLAKWHLDAAFAAPGPDDRTIHVLLTEQACASAQSPEGRVLPPVIVTTPEGVTITILVRNVPGGADCPGNPEFAMPIELQEALGGRPLFDGGMFPPFGPIAAFSLDCGPMERDACIAFSQRAVANAEGQRPGHRVIAVMIVGADGDNQLVFEDGTIVGADIN